MRTHELILYATPVGLLAHDCADYFERASALGGTVAQTYPPHCTLTGFFRRSQTRRTAIEALVADQLAASGQPPEGSVEVIDLVSDDDWIGLELRSAWLIDWTANLAERLPPHEGEDALRLKDWLHLSLAYGVADLDRYRLLAEELISPHADAQWEIALWERDGMQWTRHGAD